MCSPEPRDIVVAVGHLHGEHARVDAEADLSEHALLGEEEPSRHVVEIQDRDGPQRGVRGNARHLLRRGDEHADVAGAHAERDEQGNVRNALCDHPEAPSLGDDERTVRLVRRSNRDRHFLRRLGTVGTGEPTDREVLVELGDRAVRHPAPPHDPAHRRFAS